MILCSHLMVWQSSLSVVDGAWKKSRWTKFTHDDQSGEDHILIMLPHSWGWFTSKSHKWSFSVYNFMSPSHASLTHLHMASQVAPLVVINEYMWLFGWYQIYSNVTWMTDFEKKNAWQTTKRRTPCALPLKSIIFKLKRKVFDRAYYWIYRYIERMGPKVQPQRT